jgi:hypothetical protein
MTNAGAKYFVWADGKQIGPFTGQQIRTNLFRKTITTDDWAWREGLGDHWVKISTVLDELPPDAVPPPVPIMGDGQPEHTIQGTRQPANARRVLLPLLVWPILVLLYVVSVFFFCLSARCFVEALWRCLNYSRSLMWGVVVQDLDEFVEGLVGVIFALIEPFLFGTIGALCWVTAKRLSARLNLAKADDVRAPVIYLRSFQVDKGLARRPMAIGRVISARTEEEQLVQALDEIGRVVAIGKPGERLPRLGAQRIYVDDEHWQQQIRSWFTRAALVVIQVPSKATAGVTWEIDHGLSVVALDRLVFLVSRNAESFDWLNQKLRDHGLTVKRVTNMPRGPYGSTISGLLHFENGQAEFRALVKPPFFKRPFGSPMIPVYRSALQPVTTRITGSWRPLPRGWGDAFFAAIGIMYCIALGAILIAVGFYLADPVAQGGQRVWSAIKHQSPEARQFAQSAEYRDVAATGAWLQTHFQKGLRYVPDDVILAQANVMRRLLAIAPPANCAAIAEGATTQASMHDLLRKLGRQDGTTVTTWFSCLERTQLESLKSQHTETFPISLADVAAASALLKEGLSEEDRVRYDRITADYQKASAEDLCWCVRTIYQGVERLQEPYRSKLARVAMGQEIEK